MQGIEIKDEGSVRKYVQKQNIENNTAVIPLSPCFWKVT